MKTKSILVLIFYGIIVLSCQKDDLPEAYPYEARVVGLNSDCGIYSIKIQKDLEIVESIVGSTLDSIYIAKNLPEEMQISGLEIVLDIREPKGNELGLCTFLGPSYRWLYVIRAKKK